MKRNNPVTDRLTGQKRKRKTLIKSIGETAVRAVITATVTFAVGLVLKKMFTKSVTEAAEEGAKAGVEGKSFAVGEAWPHDEGLEQPEERRRTPRFES